MNRRQFLTTTTLGAGVAFAGCTDTLADVGGSSLPAYHTALPAKSVGGDPTTFIHVDVARLNELGMFDTEDGTEAVTPTESPTETPTEMPTSTTDDRGDDPAAPMLASPIVGSVFVLAFGFGFGLMGFGDLGKRLNDATEGGPDSDISSVTFVAETIVVRGSFDTDEYAADLPESFSETETRDGYTIYEESGESPLAVAIGSEMLVLSMTGSSEEVSGPEAVAHVLDAETGASDRLADRDGDADWALRTAGAHTFVIGTGRDPEYEAGDTTFNPLAGTPLAEASLNLLVNGASIDAFDEEVRSASSDLAMTHTDDPVDESELAAVYDDSQADVSVSVSEADEEGAQRVSISAEFTNRDLGL